MYKLSKKAEQDLFEIWDYTATKWSEYQADNYLQTIHSAITLLEDNPKIGVSRETLQTGYRCYYQEKHVIFYRKFSYGIKIVRVLHQSMDVDKHLP